MIPFRKQIKHEGPISGFHPLIMKTSQPWGVIQVRLLKSKKTVFYIKVFNLILGESFDIQFLAIFKLDFKGNLTDSEIEKDRVFYIGVLI